MLGEDNGIDLFSTVILYLLIIIMIAVLVFVSFFQLCYVNGQSMMNTIKDKDNVLLTRYDANYKTGDIIVLDANNGTTTTRLIKRIIAVEGDSFKFECEGYYVYLYKKTDGKWQKVDEPYIKETMYYNKFSTSVFLFGEEYTVPENSYLFLGDNRNDSSDSRIYGFAVKDQIVGKVVQILKKGSLWETIVKIIFHADEIENEESKNAVLSTFYKKPSYPQCG